MDRMIGKMKFEALCPLCLSIYEVDRVKEINGRPYIYCEECERNVFLLDKKGKKLFQFSPDYFKED